MTGAGEEATYHGQPLSELLIAAIDWTERGDHIRTRSVRKPGDLNIEPEWATEAAFDEERLVGLDPGSKSGWGLRVVGRSQQMNRVLTVILFPKNPDALDGMWWGATAWVSNTTENRRYNATEVINHD